MPLVGKGLAAAGLDELELMPKNGRARVHIWNFAAERIAERPVFGWGFDAARSMPDFGQQPYSEELGDTIPLHPHNAALQVWLELGAVGVALVLAPLILALSRTDRLPPLDRVFAQATFAGTLTVALIGYGIWQNQWLCTIFAAAAVMLLARPAPASDMDSRRAGV
jgi:O-antigen ligase